MEEPGRLQSMGSLESNTTERLHFHCSLWYIGEGNDNPLQCSCLENPRDGGAWWAAICGVSQCRTRLKRLSSSSSSSSICPSNEYSGLICFRIDWFHLFAVQGTLRRLESINSSVLSLLYGPTLISIHDYWKNYHFDQMDPCQQSDVSVFLICCLGLS